MLHSAKSKVVEKSNKKKQTFFHDKILLDFLFVWYPFFEVFIYCQRNNLRNQRVRNLAKMFLSFRLTFLRIINVHLFENFPKFLMKKILEDKFLLFLHPSRLKDRFKETVPVGILETSRRF